MRGAFGKPYALVARVAIGQILISIRCKEQHADVAIQALRRSMYKFPGRQRVIVSKKWGFTKYQKAEYLKLKAEGKLIPDGSYVKYDG